jgi:hypothetical protein
MQSPHHPLPAPAGGHRYVPIGGEPSIGAVENVSTAVYRLTTDSIGRDDLLAALRIAADSLAQLPRCEPCAVGECADSSHHSRLTAVRAWRALAADLVRLPSQNMTEPWLIRFDEAACRAWLQNGAAERARIDDDFSEEDGTIAVGLEELLTLLNRRDVPHVWQVQPHVEDVQIWRTADSDGVDGGGVLTADLSYLGERVRLASVHQGGGEFTEFGTAGIEAAVQALAHVAQTLNAEYRAFARATGCHVPARPS